LPKVFKKKTVLPSEAKAKLLEWQQCVWYRDRESCQCKRGARGLWRCQQLSWGVLLVVRTTQWVREPSRASSPSLSPSSLITPCSFIILDRQTAPFPLHVGTRYLNLLPNPFPLLFFTTGDQPPPPPSMISEITSRIYFSPLIFHHRRSVFSPTMISEITSRIYFSHCYSDFFPLFDYPDSLYSPHEISYNCFLTLK
jgi:hypothetical protein